jgi:hypothetical protein
MRLDSIHHKNPEEQDHLLIVYQQELYLVYHHQFLNKMDQ